MNINRPEISRGFAEALAPGNDDEQSAFFNTFFQRLKELCGDVKVDDQLFYIAKKLSPESRKAISTLEYMNRETKP